MPFSFVNLARRDHTAQITFIAVPETPAHESDCAVELGEIAETIINDHSIFVVTLLIDRATNFSSVEHAEKVPAEIEDILDRGHLHSMAEQIVVIDRPVIGGFTGALDGHICEMALACDIRIMSHDASFSLSAIHQGLIPDNGGTQRLPRLVGKGKALELILTGRSMSADEAFSTGLVHSVVDANDVAKILASLSSTVARQAPLSLRYAKEAVISGLDRPLEQALQLEADLYFLLHTTEDRTTGITSFLAKKDKAFTGQ